MLAATHAVKPNDIFDWDNTENSKKARTFLEAWQSNKWNINRSSELDTIYHPVKCLNQNTHKAKMGRTNQNEENNIPINQLFVSSQKTSNHQLIPHNAKYKYHKAALPPLHTPCTEEAWWKLGTKRLQKTSLVPQSVKNLSTRYVHQTWATSVPRNSFSKWVSGTFLTLESSGLGPLLSFEMW